MIRLNSNIAFAGAEIAWSRDLCEVPKAFRNKSILYRNKKNVISKIHDIDIDNDNNFASLLQ